MTYYGTKTWYKGVLYDSKAEAAFAKYLDYLLSKGLIKWWKRQWRFQVDDSSNKRYVIIADFLVMTDREEVWEVKRGQYTDEFIYKSQLWLQIYPNFPYYVFEPTATGWSKTPLKEFIKQYQYAQDTGKQYTWWEIKLSEWFYKLASKIV